MDGTLVPTRDHNIAEQSKNYRYSTNHQVVIDADTRLIVVVGEPLPGNRNDCKAWEESGAKTAAGKTFTMADGGYPGTGLLMPHRRTPGEELPYWKQEHNRSHKQVRARVEHVFARIKTLEDSPRLPPQGRRRPPRHARHCPTAQPRSRGITPATYETTEVQGRRFPTRRLGGLSVETELVALNVLHHNAGLVLAVRTHRSHMYRAKRDQPCAFCFKRG